MLVVVVKFFGTLTPAPKKKTTKTTKTTNKQISRKKTNEKNETKPVISIALNLLISKKCQFLAGYA